MTTHTASATLSRAHVALHETAHLVLADEFWGGRGLLYRPRWVVVHPSGRSGQIPTEHYEFPDPVEHAVMAMGGFAANILAIKKMMPRYDTYTTHVTDENGATIQSQHTNPEIIEKLCILGAQHDIALVDEHAMQLQDDPESFRQSAYDLAHEFVVSHWSLILDVANDLETAGAYYGTEALVVVRAMRDGDRSMLHMLDYYRLDRLYLPSPEGWCLQAGDLPWREPFQEWIARRSPGL